MKLETNGFKESIDWTQRVERDVPLMNGIWFLGWNISKSRRIFKADWEGIARLRNEILQNLWWKLGRLHGRIQGRRAIQLLRWLNQAFVEYTQHLFLLLPKEKKIFLTAKKLQRVNQPDTTIQSREFYSRRQVTDIDAEKHILSRSYIEWETERDNVSKLSKLIDGGMKLEDAEYPDGMND